MVRRDDLRTWINRVFLFQGQAEKDYGFEETNDQNSHESSEKINSRPVRSLGISTSTKNENSKALRPTSSEIGRSEQKGNSQGCQAADNKPTGPPQGPKISENLLQINVFFQTLNVQTVAEVPKYKV